MLDRLTNFFDWLERFDPTHARCQSRFRYRRPREGKPTNLNRLNHCWTCLARSQCKDSSIVPPGHDNRSGMARLCVPDRDDVARATLERFVPQVLIHAIYSIDKTNLDPTNLCDEMRETQRTAACSSAGFAGAHLKMAAPADPLWSTLAHRVLL